MTEEWRCVECYQEFKRRASSSKGRKMSYTALCCVEYIEYSTYIEVWLLKQLHGIQKLADRGLKRKYEI
ncbi:unnamed protein product [Larinioides sclopetarius]|uniref:Uncharacterized protein n=1 Tax=Larinioides sclopetarius TaxID=280406 RepID=A0AAV2BEZ1_9ARAC